VIPDFRSTRRVVRFAPTEADQKLLAALEEVLEHQFYGNFSALCKQALRNFLLPGDDSQILSPIVMQEQILELQDRVAMLEALGDRLGLLSPDSQDSLRPELKVKPIEDEPIEDEPIEDEPIEDEPIEDDPLLSRLALLLEDF
jgi:hypothetical protein